MANYEFKEGSITAIKDIVENAEQNKDKVDGSSLKSPILAEIIHDVWGEQVKRAYRGPRTKREYVYVNLRRIQSASDNSSFEPNTDRLTRLSDFTLPDGWTMISNKPNCVSFVRLESWEFNNTRASTELVVSQMETSAIITVKSHGFQSDLTSTVLDSLTLNKKPYLSGHWIYSIFGPLLRFYFTRRRMYRGVATTCDGLIQGPNFG